MKNIDVINNYIDNSCSIENLKENMDKAKPLGIDALEIEERLGIVRNNASTFLNELWKSGKLIKIIGRPVRFISANNFNQYIPNGKSEITTEDLIKLLSSEKNCEAKDDPFNLLVGHNASIHSQIDQAKAAIMYPPNGLHTLILGESGVGKTTFANSMYNYALNNKRLSHKSFPFISFNCSDYFNNPQLLLSQLFGHVKGAFTGADSEKSGLVEKANGGILFLDEIHRLPPDGQEMLFSLMDKGEYHPLGETQNTKKSNVLIIAATTENPDNVLLTTFLRRIPVIIKLPSLKEKDIGERIEIIEKLFYKESIRLKMPLKISPSVLKSLCVYEFKGNIGQLNSEVKLLCAKTFLQHLQNNVPLRVEFNMLSKNIKEYTINNKINDKLQNFLGSFNEDILISPSEKLKIIKNTPFDENIYDIISETSNKLKKRGFSEKEIELEINKLIDNFFNKVINKFNISNLHLNQLYKILNRKYVDAAVELVNNIPYEFQVHFNNKMVSGLAFHIQSLIERLEQGKPIYNPNLQEIKAKYKEEYKLSNHFVNKLSNKFNLAIPEDEKGFITILLAKNIIERSDNDNIGIIVICHGESTATSMAKVSNSLLNINLVKAIDMPLDAEVAEIYNKCLAATIASNKGKGILIMADMGSLTGFGDKIQKESGIPVRTINNVSTLTVLEAARRVVFKDESLDEIYDALITKDSEIIINKKKAIITVCATGKGGSIMAANLIKSAIGKDYCEEVKIIPLDCMTVENDAKYFKEIKQQYDIIACFGSMKPSNNKMPYFSINELFNDNIKEKLINIIDTNMPSNKVSNKKNVGIYDNAKIMFDKYLLYLNSNVAIKYIRNIIEELDIKEAENVSDKISNLVIHIGCMLNRIIVGDMIKFENINYFIQDNTESFLKVKRAIKSTEEAFKIKISDDEICYIVKILQQF